MTSKIYEEIKARTPETIHLDIKNVLQWHIGADNSISKEEISNKIFGKYTDSTDRQIRDAVAELVIYFDEHIVTNTTTGGYYYASNEDEINQNIADIQSRIDQLAARRDGLFRAKSKIFKSGQMRLQGSLF